MLLVSCVVALALQQFSSGIAIIVVVLFNASKFVTMCMGVIHWPFRVAADVLTTGTLNVCLQF